MSNNNTTACKKSSRKKRRFFLIVVLIFLLMDFVPYPASPNFRYTGSDPNRTVINLGFPLASLIYDSNVSPHFFVGPTAYFLFAIQLVFLAFLAVFLLLIWPALTEPVDKN
jgi:hypothetical protein